MTGGHCLQAHPDGVIIRDMYRTIYICRMCKSGAVIDTNFKPSSDEEARPILHAEHPDWVDAHQTHDIVMSGSFEGDEES